jgi:hypothetical protein
VKLAPDGWSHEEILSACTDAVGYAIYLSVAEQSVTVVKGLIGSEKEDFFRDPRVMDNSLKVDFVKAGSREIANKFDLKA